MLHIRPQRTRGIQEDEEEGVEKGRGQRWMSYSVVSNYLSSAQSIMMMGEMEKLRGRRAKRVLITGQTSIT